MPERLSGKLAARFEEHAGENRARLPVNYFVSVEWRSIGRRDHETRRNYSTFHQRVTMDGVHYAGDDVLLDFNEESDRGFVMSSDHMLYGASCGFRVFDRDGLIQRIVRNTNAMNGFPAISCDVWVHFADDVSEIESLDYGKKLFAGFLTRIEVHGEEKWPVAKVWGGHEGIVVSKRQEGFGMTASAWQYPVPLELSDFDASTVRGVR